MDHVDVEKLKKAGHADPEAVFIKIREIGEFGDIAPSHLGGLDIASLDESKRERIQKLIDSPSKDEAVAAEVKPKNK